jgi:hypothetical protein
VHPPQHRPDEPRRLPALRFQGGNAAHALPTLAFAVPPDSKMTLTDSYSYRLMRNFATRDFRTDIEADIARWR